ncbi:hypothetical protein PFLUV_G00051610 [Perca fluviatilis]|uniref:Uncharacterized protein n=1 Tax=Perca fluviatilis TaxID=8168 RepID=A0A6A5FMF7_PERFL|nr:hypothetical protein PFLUV_G00051610 [Perca fluviatilis]
MKVKGHPGPHQALRAPVKQRRLTPGTRSLKQVKEQQTQHALPLHCRLQTPHPPQFLISREHLQILLTGQPSVMR